MIQIGDLTNINVHCISFEAHKHQDQKGPKILNDAFKFDYKNREVGVPYNYSFYAGYFLSRSDEKGNDELQAACADPRNFCCEIGEGDLLAPSKDGEL
jgi:hypothetical protein